MKSFCRRQPALPEQDMGFTRFTVVITARDDVCGPVLYRLSTHTRRCQFSEKIASQSQLMEVGYCPRLLTVVVLVGVVVVIGVEISGFERTTTNEQRTTDERTNRNDE